MKLIAYINRENTNRFPADFMLRLTKKEKQEVVTALPGFQMPACACSFTLGCAASRLQRLKYFYRHLSIWIDWEGTMPPMLK
jgi:hypothetical protein